MFVGASEVAVRRFCVGKHLLDLKLVVAITDAYVTLISVDYAQLNRACWIYLHRLKRTLQEQQLASPPQ